MRPEESRKLIELLQASRWAALATARDNEPFASWVAFVAEPELSGFLLHVSRLALHTRYLETNARASLSVSEPDLAPPADPQQLARVSLQGRIEHVARQAADYPSARARYLARLPHAEVQFDLGDFELMRFVPESARYVPGFGRVHRLDPPQLRALATEAAR